MLNFNSLLLFSEDPQTLVVFYSKVFQSEPTWSGGDFTGFTVGDGDIAIGPHKKVKGKNDHPERMMFNLETSDVQGEFERIKGLGAQVIQEPYHPSESEGMWIATFVDPDGNYFQIMSPMNEES